MTALMKFKGVHCPTDDGRWLDRTQYIVCLPIPVVLVDQDDRFYYALPPADVCIMPAGVCRYPKSQWVAEVNLP